VNKNNHRFLMYVSALGQTKGKWWRLARVACNYFFVNIVIPLRINPAYTSIDPVSIPDYLPFSFIIL
jgi:hypothetical protein